MARLCRKMHGICRNRRRISNRKRLHLRRSLQQRDFARLWSMVRRWRQWRSPSPSPRKKIANSKFSLSRRERDKSHTKIPNLGNHKILLFRNMSVICTEMGIAISTSREESWERYIGEFRKMRTHCSTVFHLNLGFTHFHA